MDSLQPDPILQSQLRDPPWSSARGGRLPGTGPAAPDDWLRVDDAYAGQMALRDRLMAARRDAVLGITTGAREATLELLDNILELLDKRPDFTVGDSTVVRPDRVTVPLDRADPLGTAGRLVQQDLCLLQRRGDEHVLTAAALCFPASWMLAEKLNRPLTGIHDPVDSYDADIARRVQRLFDGIRRDKPLWRANCLLYDDPALFQPRSVHDRRTVPTRDAAYVRSERQCLVRLPKTDAILFSIHTTVVRRAGLDPAERAALATHLRHLPDQGAVSVAATCRDVR